MTFNTDKLKLAMIIASTMLLFMPFAYSITEITNANVMLFIDGNNINYTFTGYEDNGNYFGILNYYRPGQIGLFSLPETNITMNANYTNGLLTIFNATEIQNRSDWNETKTIVHLAENEYMSLNVNSSGIYWELDSAYAIIDTSDANITTNIDRDMDGYATNKYGGDDCDDSNSDINVPTTFYEDLDGDGYGNALATQSACALPLNNYISDNTDCNDNDALINKNALEINDNSVDENCDGTIGTSSSGGDSSGGGSGGGSHNHPVLVTTPKQETRTLEQPVQKQEEPKAETPSEITEAAVSEVKEYSIFDTIKEFFINIINRFRDLF